MFLYKLDIQGFKSFCDRTELKFGDGITGVIGPNGCGKTNVSDAIRWVLGEQSAKQLRGDSMEDVIFNGCPTRKPLGMAEVHLTFKNDRGILPTEFSEVTISRRVFRSGVSEYFLNKTPCRLRDIRDLFFDTGMGSHAYSVIERQMVDNILSDTTGHRRFLFEEASGITKYKQRKKEALNKLEATDGDLTRLNDIVFEIERELRSLARQVGRARRYQRLRDEVRDLDLALTAGSLDALRAREATAREEWQEEATRRAGLAAELDGAEAGLTERKLTLLEREREMLTAQGGLKDREEARVAAEHQVVLLQERASGLLRRAEEAGQEAARMRERLAETHAREQEVKQRLAATRGRRETAQAESAEAEAALERLEQELRAGRSKAAEHKQLSLDLFSVEAEKKGACERVRERQASLAERRAAAESRRRELHERAAELERAAALGEERRRELEESLAGARGELEASEDAILAVEARIADTDAALSRQRQEAAAADSRLRTLLELKASFEGISEGGKALLAERDSLPGLVGIVADVLEVPPAHLDALEASLGEAASFVLVEDRASIDPALERLRRPEGGRATLVDLSALGASPLPEFPAGPGVIGRASELVRCEPRFQPLAERLLGSVIVVRSREQARALAQESAGGLRFVSADGEVWERGRVRAGVGPAAAAGSPGAGGLLHRETEIRELSGRLAELGLALEGLQNQRESETTARARAIEQRDQSRRLLDETRSALETQVRELAGLERERTFASQEAAERVREGDAIALEIETLSRALAESEAELSRFQVELDAVRAQLADADGNVRALESRRDEAAARAQAARDALLQSSRESGELEAQWARLEQTLQELESGITGRETEAAQHRALVGGLTAEVSGLQAGLTGLVESEGSQRERVLGLQKVFLALKEEVQGLDDRARDLRFQHTELGERLHQLELDRVQARAELDRTLERLKTEYQIDPEAFAPVPLPEGRSPEDAARRLEEVRQQLKGIGPVNLLALEEYGRKKERFTFLTQQRADVTQAKTQLLEAIDRINVTAAQLFSETFAKVQENFKDIFRTLFEGGDCELRLLGEDSMEAEIEIVAKPRGKHLQSISLMSSGERALTAIALLFAIYLVKPSPFCLLDEVDAPLDDANVDRFLNMLRRFGDRTQFVVITHNKKTMEAAGSIYGVTMQELGVSKLVSVNLDGVDVSGASRREVAEVAAG